MRVRRVSTVLGVALLTPLLTVAPLGVSSATSTPRPVAGNETSGDFLPADRPEVADATAGATPPATGAARARAGVLQGVPAVSVLKATTALTVNPTLAAVGITWEKGTGADARIQYRLEKAGSWGEWTDAEVNDTSGPDPAKVTTATRAGIELVVVRGATRVQARVLGAVGHEPAQPKLTVIDPGTSDADAQAGTTAPGAAHAAAAMPTILTRDQWGADESWRRGSPESNSVKGIVIHHTADSNDYTREQVPAVLRSIYRYATKSLGWDDIAYNVIIDRWGRIWQGRAWSYPEQPVYPAATLSNNDRTMGVALLGNYDSEPFSAEAQSAVESVIAWKATLHQMDPSGKVMLFNNRTDRYEPMPTITGHRDTYATACPGAKVYPVLPTIRNNVKAMVGYLPSMTLRRDIDYMMDSDILARDAGGRLMLSSPTGKGDMTPMERYAGAGWDDMDTVIIAGDWNSDGTSDVIARKKSTGELYIYLNNSNGGFASGRAIGVNWSGMQTIVAPGDWNNDGIPDIIGTNRDNGYMYFYAGDGKGGFAADGVRIGHNWKGIKSIASIGDWNNDGKLDISAMTFLGLGVIYFGNGQGGFYDQKSQVGDWSGYVSLTGVSNAFGNYQNNLFAVDAQGVAYLGSRGDDVTTTWRKVSTSFAGYTVYGG